MTTIVYKDGVMASDSLAYSGGPINIGHKKKVFRIQSGEYEGALVGVTTSQPGLSEAIVQYLHDDETEVPDFKDSSYSFFLVMPNGEVFYANDSMMLSGPLKADHFSIGTGEMYAAAAMELGHSAEEAVEVAIKLDRHSGGPVQSQTLSPKGQD